MVKKNSLSLKLDLGVLKLEFTGEDAHECLKQINNLMERISNIAENGFDNIEYRLSEELMLDQGVVKQLNSLSQIYPNYRIGRVAIENKKIVELDKCKVNTHLDVLDVKKNIEKLLFPVRKDDIRQAIVHIKGLVKSEESQKIVDIIEQELKGAEVHTVLSKGEISSHTIVECVFFGDFDDHGMY